MPLLPAGFWQTTFYPKDFWVTDFWQEYGTGISGVTIRNFIEAETGIPWFPINTTMISKFTGQEITFTSNPVTLIDVDTGEVYCVINDSNIRFITNLKFFD